MATLALDAVAAYNAFNPGQLNMRGRLSDGFLAVDCARGGGEPMDGCIGFTGGAIDVSEVGPERWDQAFLFHDGDAAVAAAAAEAMLQIEGVERIQMTSKPEFLRVFPWWPEAGYVNALDVQLPSAVWCDGGDPRLFLADRRAVECAPMKQWLGIAAVVDLSTHGGNHAGVPAADYLRLAIDDVPADADRLLEFLPEAIGFIASRLAKGRVVVHCDQGRSPSVSVVAAWLMARRGCDFDVALAEIQAQRPLAMPNLGFVQALRSVEAETVASWSVPSQAAPLPGGGSLDTRFDVDRVDEWKAHLEAEGYVVLKSVASADEVGEAQRLLWEELQRHSPGLEQDDPATWGNLPRPKHGICGSLAQSQGQWYLRGLPRLKGVFSDIWGCDDLLCSMDCVLFRAQGARATTEGLHLDQNPFVKPELESVQGMMPLLPVTPGSGGLEVVPGSHTTHFRQRLAEIHPEMRNMRKDDDWCPLKRARGPQGKFYQDLVKSATLLLAGPGDLILWDSRTVHGGRLPDQRAMRAEEAAAGAPRALARLSCTLAMTPRAFVIPEVIDARRRGEAVSLAVAQDLGPQTNRVLRKRRSGFEAGETFNHCPHQQRSTGTVSSGPAAAYQRPLLTEAMERLVDGTTGRAIAAQCDLPHAGAEVCQALRSNGRADETSRQGSKPGR